MKPPSDLTTSLAASLLPPPSSSTELDIEGSVSTQDVSCAVTSVSIAGNQSKIAPPNSAPTTRDKELVDKNFVINHGPVQSSSHLKGAWTKKLWSSPSVPKPQKTCEPNLSLKSVAIEDAIRFPWAAKMNPASRNLYRVTEPEFLEDGTPKVTIPPHVLLQGLENQKEYILGQFYRCSPPSGGLIYAVFNKLWGRNCRITIRKLGESNYLFHIPNESTRTWVLQRGLWHVDDCLMFVASWTPEASLAIPEIKTIPVWVTLKNIPNILYSIPGISHIASGLGAPMATHKPRLDPILMGEAKILVEVELSKAFPPRIAADDENGFISMVDVDYAWLPSKCGRCGQLGHKVKRCLQAASVSHVVAEGTSTDNAMVDTTMASKSDPISAETNTTSAPPSSIEVSPTDISVSTNESNSVDPTTSATMNDLISLATISIFESMTANAVIINDGTIEFPTLESAQTLSVTPTISQAPSTVQGESSRLVEPDLGSNKFASLISLEGEEDSTDSEKELDLMDLMTPSGKRILRERPVKPTAKAKEMFLQSTGRGRGHQRRGNRGGRG